jgi:peroxiredoxin Q/BCP
LKDLGKAPLFTLPDGDGVKVKIADFRGKKNIVLYFYPKDDTPGCTREACGFRDRFSEIKRLGAVVLGVSFDSSESHRKFAGKWSLPFMLLSDVTKEVARKYGAYKQKSLYGRKFMGIERSTFVIDKHLNIRRAFRKVNVDSHTEEVLEALRVIEAEG